MNTIEKYKFVILKNKVATFLLVIASVLLSFIYIQIDSVNKILIYGLSAIGSISYLLFARLTWKCPACGAFPGSGWNRKACSACNAELNR